MASYYNELDPYAAQWLRNLIAAGHIAPGDVDERSIADVRADDLVGYTQCHFFAGIGVWSYALRRAGWADDRPVWTGSCPCQPFSAAGKQEGTADARHLWPEWFRLIRARRPAVIFGEQVAGSAVIGKPIARDEGVQAVLDRQAILRVLQESEGLLPGGLQSVRELAAFFEPEEKLFIGSHKSSRSNLGGCGQVSSLQDEFTLQLGSLGDTGPDREGGVRTDGHPVRPDGAEGVEHAVAGPDCTGGRLHEGERAGCAVLRERNEPELGAESDTANRRRDKTAEILGFAGLVGADRQEVNGEPGGAWLHLVQSDLGEIGYSCGASVISAASVGAPHIRQRLFFVAESAGAGERQDDQRLRLQGRALQDGHRIGLRDGAESGSATGELADAHEAGPSIERSQGLPGNGHAPQRHHADGRREHGGLEHPPSDGRQQRRAEPGGRGAAGGCGEGVVGDTETVRREGNALREEPGQPQDRIAVAGFWDRCDWLHCIDGKARPVEPGTFPLVTGATSRVGRLRAYGNAINAESAAEFILSYIGVMESA